MDKKTKILTLLITASAFVAVSVTFYNTVIKQNFAIEAAEQPQ
jgi:hypothetical protein